MSSQARLFVALELPAHVRGELHTWALGAGGPSGAQGTEGGVRILPVDSLHVTLCFLGSLAETEAARIATAMGEACAAVSEPVMLECAEVLWLPPRRPRVCAVALRDAGGHGTALQALLAERLAAGGWYAPERRRWLAHLSVARLPAGARPGPRPSGSPPGPSGPPQGPSGPPQGPSGSLRGPAVSGRWAAPAVTLFRSWPGSRYEPLSQVALPV